MKAFPQSNASKKFLEVNPCWEFKKCGQVLCPVYLNESSTICYYVSGTLCDGKTPQSVIAKIESCRKCDYYHYIEKRSLEFRERMKSRSSKLEHELKALYEVSPEERANIFRERAERLSKRLTHNEPEEKARMLTFCLGSEKFCIRIEHALEVINVTGINKLPCTPTHFAGIINLRGNILTLMDISELIGIERDSDHTSQTVVVLEAGGETVGMAVSKVEDIVDVSVGQIVPPLTTLKGIKEEFTEGEIIIEGQPVTLLNMKVIMRDERMKVYEMVDSTI